MRVLYVGHDRRNSLEYCPGSLVCLSLVEKISTDIQVQNCSILRQSTALPDWLNGTPIYVDQGMNSGPLRGTDAVKALQELLEMEKRDEVQEDTLTARPPSMKQRPQGAMPRMEPLMTRQPSERPKERYQETVQVPEPPIDDEAPDTMENGASNAPISDSKVTDDMLQRFMEARKNSPASAAGGQPV